MNDKCTEPDMAWQLWNRLMDLETFLWERYESEFIQRHLAEEDERQSMESDAFDEPQPF